MASVGAIALTAGFMMLALAGPANANHGNGNGNHDNNGQGSFNSQGNNGNGNAFGHDNGSIQGSENAHGNNPNANGNANNDGNGKKVDVCHATGSMTNPYVFINVSVNSLKNGHGMHADDPNKTWKDDAYWHGNHAAGSSRPDLTGVSEEYCETPPTAIQPPAAVSNPPKAAPEEEEPEAEVKGTEKTQKPPVKKPAVKGTEKVPTAVAAGIGGSGPTSGSSPIDLLAQMLVGGGLALLLSAGWMQIGRKANWVNQA